MSTTPGSAWPRYTTGSTGQTGPRNFAPRPRRCLIDSTPRSGAKSEGYYAYTLDGDKKPVWSVASNPGQCLWSGIVPPDRAKRVAERLQKPDMWSGWGIRTLSADHKSFNPYNYQTGAVWPHDNGFIALGLKRYGLHEETCAVAEAITRAVGYFAMDQLPELYAGTQRNASNFPVQYLGANVPQGWAAGSIFSLLRAMLGFQPDAPNQMLYVDPHLPAWMPELTVRDLRLGSTTFDIRFALAGGTTSFEVARGIRITSSGARWRPGQMISEAAPEASRHAGSRFQPDLGFLGGRGQTPPLLQVAYV